MQSVSFPKMFKGSQTELVSDNRAVLQQMRLLVGSEAETLFGDPEFGVRIRKYFFDQNNFVLKDVIIDELYTKICTFCPNVYIERNNIHIINSHKDAKIYATISFKNRQNFENNTFNLVLFDMEDTE